MSLKKVFVFVLICFILFCFFYYIFSKRGNNKNSNREIEIDDVLENFLNYEANLKINISSNKTNNSYSSIQKVENQYSKMVVFNPEENFNIEIEVNNNVLKITNKLLDVEKIYENQKILLNNHLFLNVFVQDFKENESKIEETNEEIIINTNLKNNPNTYIKYKELVIDKKSLKPKKLIIKDNAQNNKICIIYNDVKFNFYN